MRSILIVLAAKCVHYFPFYGPFVVAEKAFDVFIELSRWAVMVWVEEWLVCTVMAHQEQFFSKPVMSIDKTLRTTLAVFCVHWAVFQSKFTYLFCQRFKLSCCLSLWAGCSSCLTTAVHRVLSG